MNRVLLSILVIAALFNISSCVVVDMNEAQKALLPEYERELLERMASNSPQERTKAKDQLVKMGSEGFHILRIALYESDWKYRDTAADVIIELGNDAEPLTDDLRAVMRYEQSESSLIPLMKALVACNPDSKVVVPVMARLSREHWGGPVRNEAIKVLYDYVPVSDEAVEALLDVLRNPRGSPLRPITEVLIKQGKAEIVRQLLLDIIEREDPAGTEAAVSALSEFHSDPEIGTVLIGLLNTSDSTLKRDVITTLGMFSPEPSIVEALIETYRSSELGYIRHRVVHSLKNFSRFSEELVPFFIEALEDEYYLVRATAAYALSKFGDDGLTALPVLKEMLEDEENAYVIKEINSAIERMENVSSYGFY